ncbi:hypothetical protein HMPREF1550_01684 [Actinomyces sp. oral taxon 877 str. F0543]|nr:hypothetical protein HMPREF1550_01684 [Actinomyces sp. oral taxon 877 str. F0543]
MFELVKCRPDQILKISVRNPGENALAVGLIFKALVRVSTDEDMTNYLVIGQSQRRTLHTPQVKPEPIIPLFTEREHTEAITVDADARKLVQCVPEALEIAGARRDVIGIGCSKRSLKRGAIPIPGADLELERASLRRAFFVVPQLHRSKVMGLRRVLLFITHRSQPIGVDRTTQTVMRCPQICGRFNWTREIHQRLIHLGECKYNLEVGIDRSFLDRPRNRVLRTWAGKAGKGGTKLKEIVASPIPGKSVDPENRAPLTVPALGVEPTENRLCGTVRPEDIRSARLPSDLDLVKIDILLVEVCPVDEKLHLVRLLPSCG